MRGWKQIEGETADVRPSTPAFPFGRDFCALLDAVRSERTFAEGPYVEWSPSRLSELLREELPGAQVMICRTGSRIFTIAALWCAEFAVRPTPDVWLGVTTRPTAEWIARQLTEARGWERTPHYLIRDRDGVYGEIFTRRLRAWGSVTGRPRRDRPGTMDIANG
jgi:hypothetical protein